MEEEIREIIETDSWKETYKQICIAAQLDKDFTSLKACAAENRCLNRYGDVHPYDHSRVVLHIKNGRSDYINASLVRNERAKRRYILAQGPLDLTIGHFWSMVWHENSKAILMLNKLMEKGIKKCEQYWPPHPGDSFICKDVNIKVENLQSESRNDYILTNLRITNLAVNEERMVLHFQYIAWPDFGVPRCPDTFLNFLQAVRQTGSLEGDVGPPVVHCSAGIGRSGTFCLVDTSLVLIAKEGPSSVILKDILLDLRTYRMGLIQTWEQLKFSYLAIVSGAKRDNQLSQDFLNDHDISLTPTVVNDDDTSPPLPPPRTDSLKSCTTKLTNGATTHNQSKINDKNDVDETKENRVETKTDSSDKSATILNSHKMEERKREVQELRRRQLKEDKKQNTMRFLEYIKRKQRESEEYNIRRKYLYENLFSFGVGVMMVVASVVFYYYDNGS